MTSKHTPGPWRVLPEELGKPYLRVRGTRLGRRFKIANVLIHSLDGVPDTEVEETRANARLIAEAPELADSLRGLVREYESYLGGAPEPAVLVCARAVLARVDGEAPK